MSRIVLLGLFGVNNLGNDATLAVTLDHLRQRVPQSHILCVCGNPVEVAKTHGISTVALDTLPPWSFWRIRNRFVRYLCVAVALLITEPLRRRRVAQEMGSASRLLVVGTGVLDDFGELPWKLPSWLWRWCGVAKNKGARVEFLAVGAGPINDRVSRFLMMKAVRNSDRRTFRDKVSRDYMRSLGLDTSHDGFVPDLVFGLSQERMAPASAPLNPPRTIGVGLMAYYGWSNNRETGKTTYAGYIVKMARFVTWLLNNNYKVRLLIGQRGADDRAVKDLRSAMATVSVPIENLVSRSIESFDMLLAEVASTDMVVATRYHNIIGALLLGRPVISIGYADKFDALMREMSLEGYCQHADQLDVDRLIEHFGSLVSNHPRIISVIQEKCRNYKAQVEHAYGHLDLDSR